MAVYKKLYQIQKELKALLKDTEAYNYKYVTGDKLLHELRPRMDALGLLLLPEVTSMTNTPMTYNTINRKNEVVPTTEVLTSLMMRLTWVDTEDGETVVVNWAANGCNKFDKGFGSALTYGERYYLLKCFHIATDVDDVDYISISRDQVIEKANDNGGSAQVMPGVNPFVSAPATNQHRSNDFGF